ncbi:aspartyl/asparaginyl beta-hydroxylase domain-containing protein [Oceanicoccus sagamiensis]|uniref:Aspartyl/asparaginy/proline hydroxylase domain-containing protein n=1 Tax=Oceanicoccus sagamiensis TaxID=716816 RepID=A0A1X9NA60_9GAMM|nr:aspartyl/asparaginyl beta-hydroxylase domain-containing protein [Oceanicoccus sagamiensis]ARN74516.1 hypothetical protein BST96_10530 [Oceanicoccus sagamiensis]
MYQYYDLTERLPFTIDLDRLRLEIKQLEDKQWLDHYDTALADGWTTIPLVTHDGSSDNENSQRIGQFGHYKRTQYVDELPYLKELLDNFKCPHGRIRIMKLMPGTIIREHRDTFNEVSDYAFGQVRLHIPIVTNDKVIFTVNGTNYHLSEGRLHYVNFTKKHYVKNDGTEPRVHLVLDLQVNDFLENIFPKSTLIQRIEMASSRFFTPLLIWFPLRSWQTITMTFWKLYEGSLLQRIRHRLFPKT